MEFSIPIDPETFRSFYPLVTQRVVTTPTRTGTKTSFVVKMSDPAASLRGELDDWVTELKNENPDYTTCCIQMSHAIDMAFHTTDVSKMVGPMSSRRKTRMFKIAGAGNKEFRYLASVDEMKAFLADTFGDGEEISRDANGNRASVDEAKSFIANRPGIVVFMNGQWAGFHTEIWTGSDFHQDWMRGRKDPFGWAPVLFWDMGIPRPNALGS